jgi:hypothetical protein
MFALFIFLTYASCKSHEEVRESSIDCFRYRLRFTATVVTLITKVDVKST